MAQENSGRLVCGCVRIYERDIRRAAREGVRTYGQLQEATGIGTGCGNCRAPAERVLGDELARMEAEAREGAGEKGEEA